MSEERKFAFHLTTGQLVVSLFGFVILASSAYNLIENRQLRSEVRTLQAKQALQVAAKPAAVAQPAVGKVEPLRSDDHIRGDPKANVILVEYSDFECPFCKKFHPTVQQALTEYGGKVAWVYRHYPLSFHQNAQKEAEASECAAEQGGNDAFWAFSDKILEKTTSGGTGIALDQLQGIAQSVGLDGSRFQTCLDSGKYADHVSKDALSGTTAGVTGTPGTLVLKKDGTAKLVSGAQPYTQLKAAIDSML